MSAISQKSITGITSITTPAGVDNQLTLHNNNTTEAVKLDIAGNLHFHNHLNITGVSSASNFKTGSTNVHSTGIELANINTGGGTATFGGSVDVNADLDVDGHTNLDNVSVAGIVTATEYRGGGSTGIKVTSQGKVLIGTSNQGSTSADELTIENTGPMGISLRTNSTGESNVYFADGTSGTDRYAGYITYQHQYDRFRFGVNGGQLAVQIHEDKSVKFFDNVNIAGITTGTIFKVPDATNASGATNHIAIGSNSDLKLYHDNNGDAYVTNDTGHLTIRNNTSGKIINLQPKSGANGIIARYEGAAELYHNGTEKFKTTAGGVEVTSGHLIQQYGGISSKIGYISGGAEAYYGTTSNHALFIGTAGSNRIKISNTSAATSIGGSMVFNAMLTVQGDVSGQIFTLKAAENTNRLMVAGSNTNGVEINLYDDTGGQRGILGVTGTEFFIKAPNNSAPMTFYTHNGSSIGERLRINSTGGLKLSNTAGGHLIEYGGSTVNTVAAIDINRNGNGYADIRLASNYGASLRLAGASNNTDEYNITQDNQKNAYHNLEYDGFINFVTNNNTQAMRLQSGKVSIAKNLETLTGNGFAAALQVNNKTTDGYGTIMMGGGYNRATIGLADPYSLVLTSNAYPANAATGGIKFRCGNSGGGGPTERFRIHQDGMLSTNQNGTAKTYMFSSGVSGGYSSLTITIDAHAYHSFVITVAHAGYAGSWTTSKFLGYENGSMYYANEGTETTDSNSRNATHSQNPGGGHIHRIQITGGMGTHPVCELRITIGGPDAYIDTGDVAFTWS